jgi:hypothetical protein
VGLQPPRSVRNISYPARNLPDGVPPRPYKLAATSGQPVDAQFPAQPPVNPELKHAGFVVGVCNASGSSRHTVDGVAVRIDELAPYSADLNTWQFCDGWYSSNGSGGAGCGGGFLAGEYFAVRLAPSAMQGAVETATFVRAGVGDDGATKLPPPPLTLKPGQAVLMNVVVSSTPATGLYRFSFGLKADGESPAFVPLPDQLLLDSAARKWTGDACKAPAMKAQIPPGDTGNYICPASQ